MTVSTGDGVLVAAPTSWRQAWRRPWTWMVAAISFGLLGWLLWRANMTHVWAALRSADYALVGAAVPVILTGFMFRAMRWRILLRPLGEPPFWASFRSLAVGYLGNNLLPARAGEIVRVYALGRQANINMSSVFATIIVERVSDALVMCVGILLLVRMYPEILAASLLQAAGAGLVVLCGLVLAFVAMQRVRARVLGMIRSAVARMPERWRGECTAFVDNFIHGLKSFRCWADALRYSLMTAMVWSSDVLVFWLVSQAFGILLTVPAVMVVIAVGALSTAIPALPGYVGTYQFALVHTLTLFGVLIGPATAFALGVHGTIWLTANVVGVACALALGFNLTRPRVPVTGN